MFIHIGVPKSGTSFIQSTLRGNKRRLREHGVLYPSRRPSDMFHAALDVSGRHARWRETGKSVEGAWAALCRRALAFDGTTVISSEFFCGARTPEIRRALRLLDGAEVHVIVTARDMARQIPAEWQEGIKHGRSLTFARFQRRILDPARRHAHARRFWHYQDLPQVLARWAAELSENRVHLVTCPPPGAPPTLLWERFCSVIGLDPTVVELPSSGANTSLGVVEIEVLRNVNRSISRTENPLRYVPMVKPLLVQDVLRKHSSARAQTPPSLIPDLEDLAKQWRTEIERHDYDVVGDLADLHPVTPAVPGVDPDQAPAEEALKVSGDVITHLLTEIHRLRSENDLLRRRVAPASLTRLAAKARRALRR